MSEEWSPEQLAFRTWSTHAVGCRACKEGVCSQGARLREEWRTARRSNRMRPIEGTPTR